MYLTLFLFNQVMSLKRFPNYEHFDWKWWSILPWSTNPRTIRLAHLFSNPILWKAITSFVCSSTPLWLLEEFYRRFFHLVCLNLPLISKYLRLYVSTSYFKTDIVLFPAPSTLVVWLWGIFQKSYQPVFACETPTICQREQVSRLFLIGQSLFAFC